MEYVQRETIVTILIGDISRRNNSKEKQLSLVIFQRETTLIGDISKRNNSNKIVGDNPSKMLILNNKQAKYSEKCLN